MLFDPWILEGLLTLRCSGGAAQRLKWYDVLCLDLQRKQPRVHARGRRDSAMTAPAGSLSEMGRMVAPMRLQLAVF